VVEWRGEGRGVRGERRGGGRGNYGKYYPFFVSVELSTIHTFR